ncbi:XRE family transcriptional regulator [Aquipseudomonas alcaligenes]|uniref:XRE family transcriptional regulator n=1 Tax=Aquipseudomonas alcaligenes TaxID=43263 RepID=UPI001F416CE0|nr:helix-turn-helix transcriptional regulator [Pseudomonas alcaligenes]
MLAQHAARSISAHPSDRLPQDGLCKLEPLSSTSKLEESFSEPEMLYAAEQITPIAFKERLAERMKELDVSIPQLSIRTGISEAMLKNILYKNSDTGRANLILLATALKTTVEYLATGVQAGSETDALSLKVLTPEELAVALGIISSGANHAAMDSRLESLPIPRRMLSQYSVMPENVRAVAINTESLSPTLTQQDVALVDISSTQLVEGVFLLAIRDAVILRFVSPVTRGFTLSASNTHIYGTTINVDPDTGMLETPDTKVIGKVFCAISVRNL